MIKILIADDHILIREGFKKLISKEADMMVVGEAQNAQEIFQTIEKEKCDVIVLDISMPGRNGLDVLKDLREQYADIYVLILSMHPEDRFAVRALKSGASGYITKEEAPDELIKAIRKVYEGGQYVSQALAEKLARNLKPGIQKLPHEYLSDREFQVLRLLAAGKSLKEISNQLSLSLSTVNTYRLRILEKMNFKSNAELIHYAIQYKLVD